MFDFFVRETDKPVVPIVPVVQSTFDTWLGEQPSEVIQACRHYRFKAKPGQFVSIFDAQGNLSRVFLGVASLDDYLQFGVLPHQLGPGFYEISSAMTPAQLQNASIAWGMGSYRFARYKAQPKQETCLLLDPEINRDYVDVSVQSISLVRNMINTAPQDMMPEDIATVARKLAENLHGEFSELIGDDIIQDFPTVHAVGRASVSSPRIIDLQWGEEDHPKVTIIGKGVCFDSGGLDIKTAAGMLLMKKDMAGAAHALGLANMIMSLSLPIRLRVLIPAVENSVSGNAYHPGDVITTRRGYTVEVTNTDAEGRLILCDALAAAVEDEPEFIIDFATLTGAARVALGTDIAAYFTDYHDIASNLEYAASVECEPVWQLPLYTPYEKILDSNIADMKNAGTGTPYGGAIVAGLFLRKFVGEVPWLHFDLMAYNEKSTAARPEGGEANVIRAVFRLLHNYYAGVAE